MRKNVGHLLNTGRTQGMHAVARLPRAQMKRQREFVGVEILPGAVGCKLYFFRRAVVDADECV